MARLPTRHHLVLWAVGLLACVGPGTSTRAVADPADAMARPSFRPTIGADFTRIVHLRGMWVPGGRPTGPHAFGGTTRTVVRFARTHVRSRATLARWPEG